MLKCSFIKLYLLEYLIISLKNLNGIPALLFLRQIVYCRFFDMRQSAFHSS